MPADILKQAPRLFRGPISRGVEKIERDGGQYQAGLIRGAAVLTRGEAVGHDLWVDSMMLEQTRDFIAAARMGTKSRFSHPSLSGDAVGKMLGRYKNPVVDGDTLRADLHLLRAAHSTPNGDLAGYVLDLADEDPDGFANSIAFDGDMEAEEQFMADNSDKRGVFKSPDGLNKKNLPHARVAALKAVDIVDTGAANDGLFHRGRLGFDIDAMIGYALDLTKERPGGECFGVDPDRAKAAVLRYLDREGWVLRRKPTWRLGAAGREIELDAGK